MADFFISVMRTAKYSEFSVYELSWIFIISDENFASPMKIAEISSSGMRAAEYSVSDLRITEYYSSGMRTAEYSASRIRTAEYSASRMRMAEYSSLGMKTAEHSISEMRIIEYYSSINDDGWILYIIDCEMISMRDEDKCSSSRMKTVTWPPEVMREAEYPKTGIRRDEYYALRIRAVE